jgi:hypothetical protein
MKLKIEDLRVDSFATADGAMEGRGTVRANEATPYWSCVPRYTCPECAPPVMEERAAD